MDTVGTLLIAPRVGSPSPWGRVQDIHDYRDGLVRVDAERSAGYWLDHETRGAMPEALRRCPTKAANEDAPAGHWYEDGEDDALVILSFPDLFDPQAVWALLDGEGYRWYGAQVRAAIQGWTGPSRMRAEEVSKTWCDEHADWWIATSTSSRPEGGWNAWFTQVGTGDRARRVLTDAEHDAVWPGPAVEHLPGVPCGTRTCGRAAS